MGLHDSPYISGHDVVLLSMRVSPHLCAADVCVSGTSVRLAFRSNLQVRMMKELIKRAVEHVARNAREKIPVETSVRESPPPSVSGDVAPVASSWWPSFWRVSSRVVQGDVYEHVQMLSIDPRATGRARERAAVTSSRCRRIKELLVAHHQSRLPTMRSF